MAIRACTARSVLLYHKTGMQIDKAVRAAAADLHELTWFYKGRVTIYAFDQQERHSVITYSRVGGSAEYWLWQNGMDAAEQRECVTLTETDL
jgi:hypothetical protein